MCSVYKIALALMLLCGSLFAAAPLRVCADPNNLPFSNMQQQGFENALAQMVGRDLHRQIKFVWWPQRARFMEKRLKARTCDVLMGVASSFDLMLTTRPYYRSSYVFVSRRDRHIRVASLTDPVLKKYRIGVHVIGDEGETVPPAQELSDHGMVRNIVWYSLYGHPLDANPAAELISGVEHGDVDVAIAWGPLAGYFAQKSSVPLTLTPVCSPHSAGSLPSTFEVSMAVQPGNEALRRQLNGIIVRRHSQIRRLLASYGIPLLPLGAQKGCR
jgi:quinoprotein dehydrogenase-associated probable ABC transporter substrate-binding protein